MQISTPRYLAGAAFTLVATSLAAQSAPADASARARECPSCAEWNAPHAPFRVFGNTYYVGTNGLGAILITSPTRHILIDGGLPESAPLIIANIRALGFRIEDVGVIVNSHSHFDHAGGIAELQRSSGAAVHATTWSADVMERGISGKDDPQFGLLLPYPRVRSPQHINDKQPVKLGTIAITPHLTAGHTPGGTTWTWRSCDGDKCADIVYADSQTPVSADDFFFSKSATYPTAVTDFERGFKTLDALPCDILLTPHPSATKLWERLAAREKGDAHALFSATGCRDYAAAARVRLADRLAKERGR
jgi:metallo-beta-lactamase class B